MDLGLVRTWKNIFDGRIFVGFFRKLMHAMTTEKGLLNKNVTHFFLFYLL